MRADQAYAVWEDEQMSKESQFVSLPLAESMCWVMGIAYWR